ncbi:MAG: hypothetical protein A3J87_03245 [Sideroxydans sp. RIFOXYB12_FULL_59_6]|nr:MAG: hypothetical protein A3J87_03245 [Sideroxydans sp. RIFOXYB12_FULL_59_6]
MKERLNVLQIPGEPPRRWFSSKDFELIVWLADSAEILGFELCYDKDAKQRSIMWHQTGGFQHMAVDDGENRPGKQKSSPVLIADGIFDARRIHSDLLKAATSMPDDVSSFVLHTLQRHPNFSPTE